MTPAKLNHPTVRLSSAVYRGREIVCELHPYHLTLRLKGKRDRVPVPYAAALELGYKLRHRAEMSAKKIVVAARKAKREKKS